MASFQQTIIIGYLGKDPETRFMQDGGAVCNFSVACTEKWRDKSSGETKERTEWYYVNAWGKTAENCNEYLGKGDQVHVIGAMRSREYEKDGVTRRVWELRAERVLFLATKGKGEGGQRAPQQSRQQQQRPAEQQKSFDNDDIDSDIPF